MGKAHLLQLETPADDAPAMIVHTSVGDITAVLYPEVAPNYVAQFTELVEKGYYDGTYVYQTEPGVYFRAGSPNADGTLDDQLDESRQKVETETSADLWPFRGAFCAPVTEKDNNFFKMLFGNDVSYCGTRFLVCNTIEFDEETKTELADTDESAAAVTDTFLSWGGIPNYAQTAQPQQRFPLQNPMHRFRLKRLPSPLGAKRSRMPMYRKTAFPDV